jgi:Domain of Unknown Function with PDB structure (DUF3857)
VTFSSRKLRLRLLASLLLSGWPLFAQEPAQKPADNPQEKPATSAQTEKPTEDPQLPFQIQLLETHIRFEGNGDSRKEVHTIVKIINILGARQFSRVAFDYNRAFQQVDIPLIRISHANGGISELLPSAVADTPNPAVEKFPAYQDVRVKSVRILGLQEGDTLEYRVTTTIMHHPLAPDFWLEHTFDRSGQVLQENYELDLPATREVQTYISASAPPTKREQEGQGDSARIRYRWKMRSDAATDSSTAAEKIEPDVVLTTFLTWEEFATRMGQRLMPKQNDSDALYSKAKKIAGGDPSTKWIEPLYEFVAQKIQTIDLPLGSTGFRTRLPEEIMSTGYATPEDKFALFAALASTCCSVSAGLVHSSDTIALGGMPRPDAFDHVLAATAYSMQYDWMDLSLEVAPFGMVPSQFRKKRALVISPLSSSTWSEIPDTLPFAGFQKVAVDASLSEEGKLSARVKYILRGDNELLLRLAFHQTLKEKWKDVANLLAISDGFRGQITRVNASDPTATHDPFTVEYELSQPKFVDWTKNPVRIPALLPQIGVPDPPSRNATGPNAPKIELGTPLDVDTHVTLHLPAGTTVEAPAGTSVTRDYATFSSTYSAKLNTLTATRHVNFLARELPAERAADYNAFFRTLQNDQTQRFTLFAPTTPAGDSSKSPEKQKSSP